MAFGTKKAALDSRYNAFFYILGCEAMVVELSLGLADSKSSSL